MLETIFIYVMLVLMVLLVISTMVLIYFLISSFNFSKVNEIDIMDNIRENINLNNEKMKQETNAQVFWDKFAETPLKNESPTEKKYNPEEVPGALDGLFGTKDK